MRGSLPISPAKARLSSENDFTESPEKEARAPPSKASAADEDAQLLSPRASPPPAPAAAAIEEHDGWVVGRVQKPLGKRKPDITEEEVKELQVDMDAFDGSYWRSNTDAKRLPQRASALQMNLDRYKRSREQAASKPPLSVRTNDVEEEIEEVFVEPLKRLDSAASESPPPPWMKRKRPTRVATNKRQSKSSRRGGKSSRVLLPESPQIAETSSGGGADEEISEYEDEEAPEWHNEMIEIVAEKRSRQEPPSTPLALRVAAPPLIPRPLAADHSRGLAHDSRFDGFPRTVRAPRVAHELTCRSRFHSTRSSGGLRPTRLPTTQSCERCNPLPRT